MEIGSGVQAGHLMKGRECFLTLFLSNTAQPSFNYFIDLNKCKLLTCCPPSNLNLNTLPKEIPHIQNMYYLYCLESISENWVQGSM